MPSHHVSEYIDISESTLLDSVEESYPKSATAFIIGRTIRDMRKEFSISQEELAQRIGTKKSYISRVEKGQIEITFKNLVKVFEAGFGKSVTLFLKDLYAN